MAGAGQLCAAPGCDEAGEFRAPGVQAPGFDGPGDYRWFCLDHVRAHPAEEIVARIERADETLEAQSPTYGWERETRAFGQNAGIDGVPRWADFSDPLDAINKRAKARRARAEPTARKDGVFVSVEERRALETLGLPLDADRKELRGRYSQLVRKYHPDRNGGDRSYETRLQQAVEAYQLLRRAAAFA
jgi:hypothetical protein